MARYVNTGVAPFEFPDQVRVELGEAFDLAPGDHGTPEGWAEWAERIGMIRPAPAPVTPKVKAAPAPADVAPPAEPVAAAEGG